MCSVTKNHRVCLANIYLIVKQRNDNRALAMSSLSKHPRGPITLAAFHFGRKLTVFRRETCITPHCALSLAHGGKHDDQPQLLY
jgi:hypothetical protein